MKNIEIEENPLLTDRIQLSISINFITKKCKDGSDNIGGLSDECYYNSVLKEYLKLKKKYNIRYDRIKSQYYIEVPEECYKDKFPFCSHIRLRMNNPYTITTEFNFTRLVRKYAMETDSFDSDYDKSIRVADDNYINRRVWGRWDTHLIKNLAVDIPEMAFNLASHIINQYIPDFERSYEVVTVKQVEFNKDYFVGHHKSADVLHQLMYFIISSSGVEWINKLSGYGISVYKAERSNVEETRFYGDHYNPTLKFPIAKGIFFKIYRKTTDDIRFEITFQKEFIKRKFKKQGFDAVYDRLRTISKDFLKKADFKNVLKDAIDNSYSDHFSIVDNMYKFLDLTYPELSSIADSYTYKNPITDPDIIRFVKGNKRLRGLFVSSYLGNGKRILIFNPEKAKKIRLNKFDYNKYDNKYLIDLYNEYRKNNPEDRLFLKADGKTFVHKGKYHKRDLKHNNWKRPIPYDFIKN